MKISHNRQKSYANQRKKPLEFMVGDHVFLRVSVTKSVRKSYQEEVIPEVCWTLSNPKSA